MTVHSMLLAIIQQQDADAAISALINAGLRVTRISSTGGFLQTGNVTLLMELEQSQIQSAINILHKTCFTRTAFINAAASVGAGSEPYTVAPIEITVGGANIFALPIERVVHLGASREEDIGENPSQDGMKTLIAITRQDQVKTIMDDLMQAQYRATLVSTTGGFWRKRNATLLMGVESAQVNDVLRRIELACAAKSSTVLPTESSATIYVLSVERFDKI